MGVPTVLPSRTEQTVRAWTEGGDGSGSPRPLLLQRSGHRGHGEACRGAGPRPVFRLAHPSNGTGSI